MNQFIVLEKGSADYIGMHKPNGFSKGKYHATVFNSENEVWNIIRVDPRYNWIEDNMWELIPT